MIEIQICTAVLCLALAIWFSTVIRKKKFVQNSSILLKNLQEINQQYHFFLDVQKKCVIRQSLPSKKKYDRCSLDALLDEVIAQRGEFMTLFEKLEKNRVLFKDYQDKLSFMCSEATEEDAKVWNVSYDQYLKIEERLFTKQQIKPPLDCKIICIASYTSPKGRNRYSKKAEYSIADVERHFQILQHQAALQNTEQIKRKRARAQMTDKLRYMILRRDGFRCKICGRTAADGVKLHVDHIIPVSKGGTTSPDNLRTLCDACNLGKSDMIE